MVVVPPHAAARVPDSNVSLAVVGPNGTSMWGVRVDPAGQHEHPRRVEHLRVDDAEGLRLARLQQRRDLFAVDQHIAPRGAGRADEGAVGDQDARHGRSVPVRSFRAGERWRRRAVSRRDATSR